MISRVGASSPIHCTAVGKAILATMPRSRVEELLPELHLERFTRRTMTSREALLKELEGENSKLKRLLADAELDKAALKELLGRKW